MRPGRIVAATFAVLGVVILTVVFSVSLGRATVAVGSALIIVWLGWMMIAGLAQPVPEPPAPGELRKVKLTFRCDICGAEVKMTVAATQDPEPPRHCLEDMTLVTPVE